MESYHSNLLNLTTIAFQKNNANGRSMNTNTICQQQKSVRFYEILIGMTVEFICQGCQPRAGAFLNGTFKTQFLTCFTCDTQRRLFLFERSGGQYSP